MDIDASDAKPRPAWLMGFARMGYGARGLVYLVVAGFALLTAMRGGENKDTRGAIEFLSGNAAGDILTLLLIVGLASYAVWRLTQAVMDADDHGLKPVGLALRAGLLISAGVYAALTVYTFSLWWGSGAFGGDGGNSDVAHALSGWVRARYVALALASGLLVVGCAHVWKAVKRKYRPHFDASANVMRAVDPVAIAGLISRGVIFALVALLFYRRGFTASESSDNPGIKDALDYILSLPAGNWLLGATAIGLAAFSAYSFAEGIWRRVSLGAA